MAHELHRWTDKYGQAWACGAYDHGPMCRLCQPVDGPLAAILANLDLGRIEFVATEPDGELRFRLTPGGQRRVDELLQHNDGSEGSRCLCGHLANDHSEDTGLCRQCPCLIFAGALTDGSK